MSVANGRQHKKQKEKENVDLLSPALLVSPKRELSSPAGRSGRKSVRPSRNHMCPECAKPILHFIFRPHEIGSFLQPEDSNPPFASFL